ncbi:TPA: hypothetical protein ACGVZU_002144, partial [Enterococcus faecium]
LKTKKICGAQNAPHIGLSFIQICLRQHNLTKSQKICGAQNAPHIGLSFIQICLRQHNLTKSQKSKICSK